MSDYDRGKFYPKKKFATRDASNSFGRSFFNSKSASTSSRTDKDKETSDAAAESVSIKQPTILIKHREPSEDISASPKRVQKDTDVGATSNITIIPSATRENEGSQSNTFKNMTKSMKLLEDGVICTESFQDFVQENNNFLVVGVVGPQGVGKSTILNLLAHNSVTDNLKKAIFKVENESDDFTPDVMKVLNLNKLSVNEQDEGATKLEVFDVEKQEDIEKDINATQGIDMFITSNRVILLDSQPISSASVIDDLAHSENKRSNLVSEYIPLENTGEIYGLQLTSFLMSVCHILILIQDWFFDSNIIRLIQTAEMLQPTISSAEDEITDHLPHLLLLHNKAQIENFTSQKFKVIQDIYRFLFKKSKLHIETNLGLGSGRIMHSLSPENVGNPINLFLIPEIDIHSEQLYLGHPTLEELIKRLRANILGATKHSLTNYQLNEKTWLAYCSKVWDNVKKSSFFVEYTKLMP